MKCEIHIHTNASPECRITAAEVLEIAKRNGTKCLAVCDHNEISGAEKLKKLAGPERIKVIVGEEIASSDGEIIGLFLKDKINQGMSAEETVREIKKQGGLVYLPHPTDRSRRKRIKAEAIKKIIKEIDIVEIYNGRTIFSAFNSSAERLAKRTGKVGCCGSDAHTKWELGKTYCEMEDFASTDGFLAAVRNARFVCRKSNPLVHFVTGFYKLENLFRKK